MTRSGRTSVKKLLGCMPFIDLWFDAKEGAYNHVAPFITSLKWSGGAVGVRVRLNQLRTYMNFNKLAWRYHEARSPVKALAKNGHAWPADLLDYWLRQPGFTPFPRTVELKSDCLILAASSRRRRRGLWNRSM